MADLGSIGTLAGPAHYKVTTRTWTDATKRVRAFVGAIASFGYGAVASSVSGTVKENSVAAQRLVRVYRRDTGELLGAVTSDAAGVFSVPLNGFVGQVFVIAFDDTGTAPDFNAQIYDLVTPA